MGMRQAAEWPEEAKMLRKGRRIALMTLAGALAVALPVSAQARADGSETRGKRAKYVAGEAIVRFGPELAAEGWSGTTKAANPRAYVARSIAASGGRGVSLVRFPREIPVSEMVARLRTLHGIAYAEPNYIAAIPELGAGGGPHAKIARRIGPKHLNQKQEVLREQVKATLLTPSDTSVIDQWGWFWIDAATIYPDAAANPLVAVLDTGVDYLHPDLSAKVTKGKDWINDDTDPMDDNGHGTHVAGVITAKIANKAGIAGVSKGLVYAVKVLDAAGNGSHFDIAQGIYQAANLSTVRIINMSLGGSANSATLLSAVTYAVNTKSKLVVAAAGNDNVDTPFYPAFYSQSFPGKVIAVAADGVTFTGSTSFEQVFVEGCKGDYSNFGSWVTVSAPGTDILSTTPYDKAFYLNQYSGVAARYDYLSGTSMAAPHVAGTAARVLGRFPSYTVTQVFDQIVNTGFPTTPGQTVDVDNDGTSDGDCWPASNNPDMTDINVALAMERGRFYGRVMSADSALPLTGAKVTAFQGTSIKGFGGDVTPYSGNGFYDVINLPFNGITPYTLKVNKTGFTAGAQAFDTVVIDANTPFNFVDAVAVPQYKPFAFVTQWGLLGETAVDLDQYLWLPIANACIIPGACSGEGTLVAFPFARRMHDGLPGELAVESTTIKTVLTGTYGLFVTDYGDGTDILNESPFARLWQNGVVKATVRFGNATIPANCVPVGGPDSCPWWHIGNLSKPMATSVPMFTPANVLGDGLGTGDPLPYVPNGGTVSITKK